MPLLDDEAFEHTVTELTAMLEGGRSINYAADAAGQVWASWQDDEWSTE